MNDFTLIQVPNRLVQPLMYPYSLSLLMLAAMLERAGAKVGCEDLREKRLEEIDLEAIPLASWYGFTATTPEYSSALALARLLKAKYPGSRTIIGGAHASALPEDCKNYFDIVAVGEWEFAIIQLLEKGHPGGVVYGGPVPDLDAIPFPARHLAGDGAFSTTLMPGEFHGEGEKAAMLISSRGCPYNCYFCASARTLPVRLRSPENVAAEVEELVERFGVRAFRDESDNLNLKKPWLLKLCQLLKPLGVRWKGHGRSALLDEEEVEAMVEAGLVEFGLGVESADPEVLKLVGKGETVEDHRRAISLLKKHGVKAKIYLMSGLPGETEKTLELSTSFMAEAKPDKWTLSRFTPLPGCEVFRNPAKYQAVLNKDSFNGYWFFFEPGVVEYNSVNREELERRHQRMFEFLKSEEWRR